MLYRLQYTLFLKGTGLPLNETLKFFKIKYSKKITPDKFEKEYAYYIKHSYGLEGKKFNYIPYSCLKIIEMKEPIGKECHGCPFKNNSIENLRVILNSCNLNPLDIEEIIDKKRKKEYQVACIKFYDAKFPKNISDGIGIHPNKYFHSAMNALKLTNNKNK